MGLNLCAQAQDLEITRDNYSHITERAAGTKYYGAVKPLGDKYYQVLPDTPWDPNVRPLRVKVEDVEVDPATWGGRRERQDAAAKQAGYTRVGDAQWIQSTEAALANRAREMAEKAEAARRSNAAEGAPAVLPQSTDIEPEPATPLGPLAYRGPQLAVMAGAIVLCGLLLWAIVLR